MPYVNIKITRDGVTADQKTELIKGVTGLLAKVLDERKFIEDLMVISMAGAIAEQRSAPAHFDPKQAVDDHQFVADNLGRIVGHDDAEAGESALRSRLQARAEAFVDEHWNAIDQLAKALAAKGGGCGYPSGRTILARPAKFRTTNAITSWKNDIRNTATWCRATSPPVRSSTCA